MKKGIITQYEYVNDIDDFNIFINDSNLHFADIYSLKYRFNKLDNRSTLRTKRYNNTYQWYARLLEE